MRVRTLTLTCVACLLLSAVSLTACGRGQVGGAVGYDTLLTEEDVERVLRVEGITRTRVSINPAARYQAVFSDGTGTRLVIMNVLDPNEWDELMSIGTTSTIDGLGSKAVRSSDYGVVFLKGGHLVTVGTFTKHPDAAGKALPSEYKILELAILVASRL